MFSSVLLDMHDIFHKKKHLKEKEKEVNIRKMGYSHQAR